MGEQIHSINREVIADALSTWSTANETKTQILDAYLKIAVHEGASAISLTRLADELKISKQLVRYHVPDLDQAAVELFRIIVHNGSQYIKFQVDTLDSSAKKVLAWCDANFDWFVAYPDFGKFMIYMYHRSSVDLEVRVIVEKVMRTAKLRIQKLLEDDPSRRIRKNPALLARTIHHCTTASIIEMIVLNDLKNHTKYRQSLKLAVSYLLES